VIQRGTLIAVLIGVEIALVVMMAQAISPGASAPWHDAASNQPSSGRAADYTFHTGPQPEVTVDIGYADLTVYQHSEPGIAVNVTGHGWHGFGSSAPPITATQDGNIVNVSAAESSGFSWGDDRMVTIAVAPGTRLTVNNAGNIKATGLRAQASFKSVGNGTVWIEDFNGPSLDVASSNGRLTMHNIVARQLDAESSNGRVEVTGLQVRDGNIDSSNGRVSLGFAPGADTTVTAATSNGHINVSGFTVTPAKAVKHGDDDDDDDDDSTSARTIRVGSGSGRLGVHTSNGSIYISQEG
jgi:Putative adhesin